MKWYRTEPSLDKKVLPYTVGAIRRGEAAYNPNWDTKRAITEAVDRVTWVFRCVDAIASNQARLKVGLRENDRFKGQFVEANPLDNVLNGIANNGEPAVYFRYRLSAQFLLSKKGVFVQVVRSRGGEIIALVLLPPDQVKPIKDSKTFISGYELSVRTEDGRERTKKLSPEEVIWIRRPHPTDAYGAMTPLESAGLAIETDWYAKLYNRNFLLNDGRPGGIVAIKGDADAADLEEIRARFSGGIGKAGRITVIASEQGADFVDTAVTPRDAQHQETRNITKDEILIAFGVPESVLANASGRSFDNAEQERLIFWQETMLAHLELIAAPLDVLDENANTFVSFDTSSVDVLQRAEMKRREFLLREMDAGATTTNEYRSATSREPILAQEGNALFIPKTKVAYAMIDGSPIPQHLLGIPDTAGRPQSQTVTEQPTSDPTQNEGDQRLTPLDNTPNSAPDAQLSEQQITVKDLDDQLMAVDNAVAMWGTVIRNHVEKAATRMARVTAEKIGGPAFKKAFYDPTITGDDETSRVFDKKVWENQLIEDLMAAQRSAWLDGVKIAGGGLTAAEFSVSEFTKMHVTKIVKQYAEASRHVVDSMRDRPDFAKATLLVAEAIRSVDVNQTSCDAVAFEAIQKGISDACEKNGTEKALVSGQTIEFADKFGLFHIGKTSKKAFMYGTGKTVVPVLQEG